MMRLLKLLRLHEEKEDIGHLPATRDSYVAAFALAAAPVVAHCALHWEGALGRVPVLPGLRRAVLELQGHAARITTTLSVNFLFILVAVTELTLRKTADHRQPQRRGAALSGSAQTGPSRYRLLFAVSSMTLSAAAAFWAYHNAWMPDAMACGWWRPRACISW